MKYSMKRGVGMKKRFKLLVSFFVLFTLFACANEEKPLDQTNDLFVEKSDALFALISEMESSNNFTIVMTAKNVPLFGSLVITTKLDGDKQHDVGFLTDRYLFNENGTRYELSEDFFGDWNRTLYDGNLIFDYLFIFNLSSEMFDYEGGQWVLKDIYLKDIFGEEDDIISMRIDVNNNEITVYFSSLIDGVTTLQEVEFKDIRTTTVIVPEID